MTEDLVSAARSGDRQALEQLLESEASRLYAFGLRMCGDPDDARDVLQDTMLAIARGIGGFRGEASLRGWMFQLARHACSRHRRRPSGAPAELATLDDFEPIDPAPSPESQAEAGELAATVQAALDALSPTLREVLVLRDVEGLTAPEVADALELSVDAVKSRLHRARTALREALAGVERGRAAGCPDVLARWSEKLEGELSSTLCAEIEKHVAGCARCHTLCNALERNLAECRSLAVVPVAVQARVRDALRDVIVLTRRAP